MLSIIFSFSAWKVGRKSQNIDFYYCIPDFVSYKILRSLATSYIKFPTSILVEEHSMHGKKLT